MVSFIGKDVGVFNGHSLDDFEIAPTIQLTYPLGRQNHCGFGCH